MSLAIRVTSHATRFLVLWAIAMGELLGPFQERTGFLPSRNLLL
jgi:hypothetical protein